MWQRHVLIALVWGWLLAQHVSPVQGATIQLTATGSGDSAAFLQKLAEVTSAFSSEPTLVSFRTAPSPVEAQAELRDGKVDFAAGSTPMTEASVIHVPFGWSTVSIYFNAPGSGGVMNLTACLVAELLSGSITSWGSPRLKDINKDFMPALEDASVKVLTQASTHVATMAITEYLAKACPSSWTGKFSESAVLSKNITSDLLHIPYSIGYHLSPEGKAAGLQEASLGGPDKYMVSSAANASSTVEAIAAQMPASFDNSFSSVSGMLMSGQSVFPITLIHYLYVPKAATGDKGALLQAVAKLAVSKEGQGLLTGTGLFGIKEESDISKKAITALDALSLGGAEPFVLESAGEYTTPGANTRTLSANRQTYLATTIAALQAEVDVLRARLGESAMRTLHGSGSSAVSLVMWRLMDQFMSMSSNPVYFSYRAIGSTGGRNEFMAKDRGYKTPYVDFGASDVAMPSKNWEELDLAGIEVLQIPIGIAPMSFFVNIPSSVLPVRKLKLSPCTVAKLFSGAIKSWSDAAVTEDNGSPLPDEPVTFAYRASASGSTSLITEYLARACPAGWTLGSGDKITAWEDMENGVGASSTLNIGEQLRNNTFSIGYMEAGVGATFTDLLEVSLKNKAGQFLTNVESDVSASAELLFEQGGWPADPTDDFSSVSLLDQPGEKTWPISSMPVMMVRLDMVDSGPTGALLVAFINYMLQVNTQRQLTSLGFSPLPENVLTYTITRALPRILIDTSYPQWFFETKAAAYKGAGDSVLTNIDLKSTYTMYSVNDLQVKTNYLMTSEAKINTTELMANLSSSSTIPPDLMEQIEDMDNRIQKMQTISIAAIAFGVAAAVFAMFSMCRVFITAAVAPSNEGFNPGNMSSGGSIRHKSFNGDSSVHAQSEVSVV